VKTITALLSLFLSATLVCGLPVIELWGCYYQQPVIMNETALYLVVNDLHGNNCLNPRGNNSILDCQGHSITGNNLYGTSGLFVGGNNITIKNCVIRGFGTQIAVAPTWGPTFLEDNSLLSTLPNANGLMTQNSQVVVRDNLFVGGNNSIVVKTPFSWSFNPRVLIEDNTFIAPPSSFKTSSLAMHTAIYCEGYACSNAVISNNLARHSQFRGVNSAGVFYGGFFKRIWLTNSDWELNEVVYGELILD